MGKEKKEKKEKIVVLSDGETWDTIGYKVEVTDEEMDRILDGEKLYSVVGWDRLRNGGKI